MSTRSDNSGKKTPWASIARITIDGQLSGTGFLVADKLALTALHVVADDQGTPHRSIELEFFPHAEFEDNSPSVKTGAKVLKQFANLDHDFALLECERVPDQAQPLLLSDRYRQFRKCSATGFACHKPSGFEVTGHISSLNEPVKDGRAPALGLQFDFDSGVRIRGHSGAPVFADGGVIGLLRSACLDENEKTVGGLLQATPIPKVVDLCNQVQAGLLSYAPPIAWPQVGAAGYPTPTFQARADDLDLFHRVITGRCKQRVLLLSGERGFGKTPLANEMVAQAKALGVRTAQANLKLGRSADSVFRSLLADLRDIFETAQRAPGHAWMSAMIDDLAATRYPVVIAIDHWEDALEDTSKWIQELLADLDRMPGIVVVIGGQTVPNHECAVWKDHAAPRALGPVHSVAHWTAFAHTALEDSAWLKRDHVEAAVLLGNGKPSEVAGYLSRLTTARKQQQGGGPADEIGERVLLEVASVPRWFDGRVLAQLLDVSLDGAELLTARLIELPQVETLDALRRRWNVHEATRLGLRRKMQVEQPRRFVELSAKAAALWRAGEDVESQLENIYHLLAADPDKGADLLEKTYWKWQRAGRHEATQALGVALNELCDSPLSELALGRVLLVLGWIRLGRIPLERSEQVARRALESLARTGPEEASYGDARCLLGEILERGGKRAEALEEYQACKRIMASLVKRNPTNTDWQRDLSVAHNRVGNVYKAQGKRAEALAEYQEAKSVIASQVQRHPANGDWQRELSVAHSQVGSLCEAQGQQAEALAEYQATKSIMASLVKRDSANIDWQRDLSVAHNCVGNVYAAQGKLAEALAEYQAYKRIIARLVKRDLANTDWQRELSVAHNCVGCVYELQGKRTKALAEYQASRRLRVSLAERDPANADWKRDLSVAHVCVGSVYATQGRWAEALAEYQASKRIMASLVQCDPTNTDWRRDLSVAHNCVGRVCEAQGQRAGALAEYQAGLQIAERLAALDPTNVQWQEDVRVSGQNFARPENDPL